MNHLSMEQLLQLQGPATDPGIGDARAHLASCQSCQAELDRLHQRVARLKALPALRPARDAWPAIHRRVAAERARDAWPAIHRRVAAERHQQKTRWMGIAGLAMAASVTLAVILTDVSNVDDLAASTSVAIDSAKAQSRELEQAILQFDPESRVIDGRTARLAADVEDQIAELDRELQEMQVIDGAGEHEVLRLWRQRVGLLDALVDIHVTRASNVGL